ncbi:hypothetical protein [Streptomyces fuscichromogenes]|uniref:Uncharacterized protein n=1 Tax=Streptomyces fuscichromogenes TaxID=1324013 RepID=A0A918CX37_9ACTN|nr:hypothetical protein [Streptomyces fuscichromogenes]GGN43306.1 hypothetical protein GCM10011578_093420 [Streptomyces fuscichromogenes]
MKRPGPLLTLLAGLLLGLFMLTLNVTTGTRTASSSYQERSPSPSAPSRTAATATATASPSSPSPSLSLPPSPAPSKISDASYAGRTDDDSSSVAVSVRDGRAIAYFCDGHSKESWLKGRVNPDGSMRLTGGHGAVLNGTVEDDRRVRGAVDLDGGHYSFTARRAVKGTGLYRATATVRGAKVDGGWIVLADGRQVGIVDRDGTPSAAPRIDPETGAVTVDGQQLTASPVVP